MPRTTMMWLRRDLRVADNAALRDAAARGERVVAVFVPPAGRDAHAGGPVALDRLQRSATSLASNLARAGCELEMLSGSAPDALAAAARRHGATIVTCLRDWTPAGSPRNRAVQAALARRGDPAGRRSQLLATPGPSGTGAGTPFRVFTPFYRQWLRRGELLGAGRHPREAWHGVAHDAGPARGLEEQSRRRMLPRPSASARMPLTQRLEEFVATGAGRLRRDARPSPRYAGRANCPRRWPVASSRLGRWRGRQSRPSARRAAPFLRQLAWREFAYHALPTRSGTLDHPLRPRVLGDALARRPRGARRVGAGRDRLAARGRGMRQLAQTGWMHNRVRMVVASVLTKDLLVPWQHGAAAFERDARGRRPRRQRLQLAVVAGSGADAAPYFRIFSPTLQGTRFDPDGAYVRRWVPELGNVPVALRAPSMGGAAEQCWTRRRAAGDEYPIPLIDHGEARTRALAALSVSAGEPELRAESSYSGSAIT